MNPKSGMQFRGTKDTYTLDHKLGKGGNGEVWRATCETGDVAIKILKGRGWDDARPRFSRELTALDRLAGIAGVLPLIDFDPNFTSSPQPWFVMPVAESLRERLGANASLKEVCAAFSQIAEALTTVHRKGIGHRDIKPDNLFWHNGTWSLGDFGLADFDDAEALTASNNKLGPMFYIAPEMLNDAKHADGKLADIYSLAKSVWVCATGQTYPLPGVHEPAVKSSSIASFCADVRSSSLDELLRRMTLTTPGERLQAERVAQELASLAKDIATSSPANPASSLQRLRAAVVPYISGLNEQERQERLAKQAHEQLFHSVNGIALIIQEQTGLKSSRWHRMPHNWQSDVFGSPREQWKECDGFEFSADGRQSTAHLGIGFVCQLFTDNMLFLSAGYHLQRRIDGSALLSSGVSGVWHDGRTTLNGTPSCAELINELRNGLSANLTHAIDTFVELIGKC